MKTLALLVLLALPFASHAEYRSWLCDGDQYKISPDGPAEILSCIQEAWHFGSHERVPNEEIRSHSNLLAIADFNSMTATTLNRRLVLKGYPSANFLTARDFEKDMTAEELTQLLVARWSKIYCSP